MCLPVRKELKIKENDHEQQTGEGMANAAQWSLVAATAFFALSFVGALRVLRAAGGEGERRESPANNADLGARVNRVPN